VLTLIQLTVASKKIAQEHGGLCSTGILSLEPGSTNVIPSRVRMTLDMRHAESDEALREMETAIISEISRIAAVSYAFSPASGHARPCEVHYRVDSVAPLARFHPDCITAVRQAAQDTAEVLELPANGSELTLDLFSGAGHDTCATSTRVPSTMIFAVSEREGVSHHPTELTTPQNCAIGAQTLLGAVLHYDMLRESRDGR
jgi:acetylornithine deacetylase/succinyl-diaminopimelate desuccinylase-like protein